MTTELKNQETIDQVSSSPTLENSQTAAAESQVIETKAPESFEALPVGENVEPDISEDVLEAGVTVEGGPVHAAEVTKNLSDTGAVLTKDVHPHTNGDLVQLAKDNPTKQNIDKAFVNINTKGDTGDSKTWLDIARQISPLRILNRALGQNILGGTAQQTTEPIPSNVIPIDKNIHSTTSQPNTNPSLKKAA